MPILLCNITVELFVELKYNLISNTIVIISITRRIFMKLKKSIAVFLSALLVMSVVFSSSAFAVELSANGFNYQRIGTTSKAEITGITAGSETEASTTIAVPSSLGGCLITTIGTRAFSNNDVQEEIILPTTITEISTLAFYNATALKTITIPHSVQTIKDRAFANCTALETVNFNVDNLMIIPKGMFYSCTSLNNVIIPTSVNTISSMAFSRCTSLTNIYIPSNVSVIEDDVFLYSDNVTIYGSYYTTAHYYALENNIPFVNLPTDKDTLSLDNWIVASQYKLSGDMSDYIPATVEALQIALTDARAVKNNFFSSQAEIDASATNLSTAYKALKLIAMPALEDAVATAKTYTDGSTVYTEETITELSNTIASAEELMKKSNATSTQVIDMTQLVNDKINALVLQSKADLQTLVDNANAIVEADVEIYTESSISALTTAIASATTALENAETTDTAFKAEIENLTTMLNALQLISYDTLTNNVATAQDTLTNAHKYTATSVEALQVEIDASNTLLANPNATNDELVAQNDKLTQAYNSLVAVTLGDVNSDGEITVTDVLILLRNVIGVVEFDARQQYIADMNSDGTISVVDGIIIKE